MSIATVEIIDTSAARAAAALIRRVAQELAMSDELTMTWCAVMAELEKSPTRELKAETIAQARGLKCVGHVKRQLAELEHKGALQRGRLTGRGRVIDCGERAAAIAGDQWLRDGSTSAEDAFSDVPDSALRAIPEGAPGALSALTHIGNTGAKPSRLQGAFRNPEAQRPRRKGRQPGEMLPDGDRCAPRNRYVNTDNAPRWQQLSPAERGMCRKLRAHGLTNTSVIHVLAHTKPHRWLDRCCRIHRDKLQHGSDSPNLAGDLVVAICDLDAMKCWLRRMGEKDPDSIDQAIERNNAKTMASRMIRARAEATNAGPIWQRVAERIAHQTIDQAAIRAAEPDTDQALRRWFNSLPDVELERARDRYCERYPGQARMVRQLDPRKHLGRALLTPFITAPGNPIASAATPPSVTPQPLAGVES